MRSALLRSIGELHTVELSGVPVSRGHVTGTARIIRSANDIQRVRRGDVVVCELVTRDIERLFSVASAVVAESGGVLSNAATVARELGLPAVFGVNGASRVFVEGQRVTVDGWRGRVIAS